MLKNSLAAALPEERLITDEYIGGPKLAGFDGGEKPVGLGKSPHSEALQDVAHQGASTRARHAVPRGRVFLKKTREVPLDLVLIAERIGWIFVEYLTMPFRQAVFDRQRHQYTGVSTRFAIVRLLF